MSTPNISLNPNLMNNAAGTFGVDWNGLIQGMAMPDPPARNWLSSGWLSNDEDIPMWGGILISEAIPDPPGSPATTPQQELGGAIIRATNITGGGTTGTGTGFSVFDQNFSAINTPSSEVPVTPSYGSVHFYRFGTNARIAVPCSADLASIEGNPITKQVSWDYVNGLLVPYQAAFDANTISGATWAAGVVTATTGTAHGIAVGGVVEISGVSPAGYNGTFVAVTGTTASTLKYAVASDPGAYSSGGVIAAGGGALPCKVLKFEFGKSMTVSYNSTTGFANWNRSGNAALILI